MKYGALRSYLQMVMVTKRVGAKVMPTRFWVLG